MAPAPPPTWDPDHPSLTLACCCYCGLHVSFQCKSRLWFCCFKGMNVSLACILLPAEAAGDQGPAGSLQGPGSRGSEELSGLSIKCSGQGRFPGGPVPGLGISKARHRFSPEVRELRALKLGGLAKKKKFKCRVMYTFFVSSNQ